MASRGASQEARKERETAQWEGNDGLRLTKPRFGRRQDLLSTGYACGKEPFRLSNWASTISIYIYIYIYKKMPMKGHREFTIGWQVAAEGPYREPVPGF